MCFFHNQVLETSSNLWVHVCSYFYFLFRSDIIARVKKGGSTLLRPPRLSDGGEGISKALIDVLECCWTEDPQQRPPFTTIRSIVKAKSTHTLVHYHIVQNYSFIIVICLFYPNVLLHILSNMWFFRMYIYEK